jgi:transcriptional regulator with XRE-family HTH domain
MLRRWEVGNALRQIREERGMTIADVTAAMKERYGSSFSTTKLSRLETAKRGVIPRDVHDLCIIYDVSDDERDRLLDLAIRAHEGDAPATDEHERGYLWFATLEKIALSIREYSAMYVPGLLQTQDYARVVENLQFTAPDYYSVRLEREEIPKNADDRVEMRLERQAVLEGDNPPRFHVILDDSVLRRRLPDPDVMNEQLNHLIEMSKRPNICIQVIPFEAGLYPGSECSYWSVLNFPNAEHMPRTTIYAEAVNGVQIIDRDVDVARMVGAFEVLTRLALDPDTSRDHIVTTLRH